MERRAEASPAAFHHGKGDGMAEDGAQISRSDMAEARTRGRTRGIADELGAFLEHASAVEAQEPHELLAVGSDHRRAGERALADEVLLCLADRPGEPEII